MKGGSSVVVEWADGFDVGIESLAGPRTTDWDMLVVVVQVEQKREQV